MPAEGYCLELINLGRCLQDPACLREFEEADWNVPKHKELFEVLSSNRPIEEKRKALSEYLLKFGVDPRWVDYGKTAIEACTESQKLNTLEADLAVHALGLVQDLQSRRFMGDKTAMLSAIDRLKKVLE